ncbi:MAG: DUF2062 domain-containing protein [Bryobacteraceae bacterium]
MNHPDRLARHRWLQPFMQLLRQGMSPEKLALTVALGAILGVTPVLGSTTLLCTLAAVALRLNLPAIQLVNGVVYPLQFLLLIPFYKAGAWMFGADASSVSLEGVLQLMRDGIPHAISALWTVTMRALAAWLIIGTVSAGFLFTLVLPVIRRIWRRMHANDEPAGA